MKSIICIISAVVISAAIATASDKKHSNPELKKPKHGPETTVTEKKPASGPEKSKHGTDTTMTAARLTKLDTNNDRRISREEFKASPLGKADPGKAEKIFKNDDK